MSSTVKTIIALVIALIISNGCWMLKFKDVKIEQEREKTKQAKEYAEKLEYQQELTKSSIQTVTEETNHYMKINEELEKENNELQKRANTILLNDKCANSNIPDDVKRLYTTH